MSNGQCRACHGQDLAQFLDLGTLPLAGAFLTDADQIAGEQRFPLVVHVCGDCGLIQIIDPIDPEVLFKEYFFSSSTVGPLVEHFKGYAEFIVGTLRAESVIEFGCNDGILLERLRARKVAATGIDISVNITEMARAKGLDVVTGFFNADTAGEIRARSGPVDLVTGSNCFAHNDDPDTILSAARIALKDDGLFAAEVMYAGDLLDKAQWDTLYHEHLMVYSLGSIETLLQRNGYALVDVFHLPMHAGSIRVLASPDQNAKPSERVAAMKRAEADRALNAAATWRAFGAEVSRQVEIVGRTLKDLAAANRIWGYGASGRAAMWLNACGMDYLERMVDDSPLRAGTLMPGTHTPVVLPEEMKAAPPDYVFVTAWNYADVIREKESWYPGIWITPLPKFEFS